jgi:hypothetical protein
MDYTQPHFWIALGIGGSLIASLSAAQQLASKNPQEPFAEAFRIRPVVRDFCIGAFLTAVVYMLLPESMTSWIEAGQATLSNTIAAVQKQTGGGSPPAQDFDLQIGPARF